MKTGWRSLLFALVSRQLLLGLFLALIGPFTAEATSMRFCKAMCRETIAASCSGLRKGKLHRCRTRLLKKWQAQPPGLRSARNHHDLGTCDDDTATCDDVDAGADDDHHHHPGPVREPDHAQRHRVRRQQRVHDWRHLPEWHVHRIRRRLRHPGSVPQPRCVRPRDGSVRVPIEDGRHAVQRRQRVHCRRHVPGGKLRRLPRHLPPEPVPAAVRHGHVRLQSE